MITTPYTVADEAHPHCIVCGREHPFGLRLEFVAQEDGSVRAELDCPADFQGYPGILHGGVISSLLDGAMTHCLFARGHRAMTGELNVRFRHPVSTNSRAVLRAWIDHSAYPFFVMKANLVQAEQVMARGSGKFVGQANQ